MDLNKVNNSNKGLEMYQIKKELHPEIQRPEEQWMKCAFCMYPVYTSNNGHAMLETRNGNELWRSEDNGSNWTLLDTTPPEEKQQDGSYKKWSFGPFFHDAKRDVLIQFIRSASYRCPPSEVTDYNIHVKMYIQHSPKTFYRISNNGGLTWNKQRQLIEDGKEYNENHYAKGYWHGKGTMTIGEIPPYMTFDDGTLMLPYQGWCRAESEKFGSIQAGRLFGRWDENLHDYRWTQGGRVPGGGCEQTIVRLKDGRLLNVLRTQGNIEPYYFDLRYRPYSISEDDGKTWSKPEPLCLDDGKHIVSPRAWSQLIRASNDKLYWIANILPDNEVSLQFMKDTGRADPRYPVVIAEVCEETLTLKRATATTIIDREEGETKYVRFSNFFCYNDSQTGEIVMLMQKSYHENQPDLENMPHPAWRFRIQV